MKTGKLALLAALMSALTLGGLAAPAAALAPTVQATDTADGSEIAVDPAFPAPSPPAAGEGEPDGGSAETIVPSPEVPVPPAAGPTSDVAAATTQPPADEETSEPDDDGFVYVPVGEGHVVPGPDTPLITEADGSVRSAVETEEHEQAASTQARGGAASMLSAPARAGNIKVTLVRATVQGNGNLVNLAAARNSVSSANSYWKAMSNNRLSMSITSERVHYSSTANAWDDYATIINKIARELKWVDNPYTALVVFVPTADLGTWNQGQWISGLLGGGWTNGGTAGRILMPAPSAFTNNVVTHEVGHVLGLLHANSLQCTNGRSDVGASNGRWNDGACSSREYGDTTDLMGSAQYNQPVINSYFWDDGRFGSGNEVLDIGRAGSPRTFTLKPWGGTGSNRAIKFTDPHSGEVYYVELRQPAGFDQYLASSSAGNRGVKVIKADQANPWAVNSLIIPPSTRPFAGYYNNNHTWQAGQTFTTHAGTEVRINSVSSTSASITVTGSAAAQATNAIESAFAANPGIGSAVSGIVGGQKGDGAYRKHRNGTIFFSPSHGAYVVGGAILSGYEGQGSHNGFLGYPTSGELRGGKNGAYQNFQGGVMYWSAATGARSSGNGEIRQAYARHSYEHGPLGYPTSEYLSIPGGGLYQNFEGGSIMWKSGIGAHASLSGPLRTTYAQQGYQSGKLGYPTSDEYYISNGRLQDYQGGRLIWSTATGTRTVAGSIGYAYMASGGPGGPMGFPTSNEVALKGGASQKFQNGTMYWSATTGAVNVPDGPLNDGYQRMGAEKSKMGFPTRSQASAGKGRFQSFQGGVLTWASGSEVRSVTGAIGTKYAAMDGAAGSLGFPTADAAASKDGVLQTFQKGTVYWSLATGAVPVTNGALHDVYKREGGAVGGLGYPVTHELPAANGGVYQTFQNATIYWSPAGGAHVNRGSIRYAYAMLGYEHGFLGFPTSGEVSIKNGGVYQSFQGGTIYWSPVTGAHANAGGVRAVYARLGWENGSLGYPTGSETKIKDGGVYQSFEGGTIYWSPATGGHPNAGAIRTAYARQGWENGRLGFPTSGEYSVAGGTEQSFQGGRITYRTNGSITVTYR